MEERVSLTPYQDDLNFCQYSIHYMAMEDSVFGQLERIIHFPTLSSIMVTAVNHLSTDHY